MEIYEVFILGNLREQNTSRFTALFLRIQEGQLNLCHVCLSVHELFFIYKHPCHCACLDISSESERVDRTITYGLRF